MSTWNLEPVVFRSQFKFPLLPGKSEAESRLNAERHIAQDFMTYSAHLRPTGMERAELYAMQQHYKTPTRLLDWSTNPLVALFLQCSRKGRSTQKMLLFSLWTRTSFRVA
ncbi:MAG: FRG domain-containing protein [Rhodospirillales bacterium]|nr:FRG domain-containing protein [Acetobacter sp.]